MASTFADEVCDACSPDETPLTQTEYHDYLTELEIEVWEVVDGHHLAGRYTFTEFRTALEFTYEIGELAVENQHHPVIQLDGEEVRFELWTHTIDGLHKTDFVLAAKIDRIYEAYM